MADKTTDNADAATLEREVRQTQDEMGDTVEKLEEKLNPKDITRSVMGKGGQDVANDALDVVRRNPIPVALIAVGAIWLFASSDAPMIRDLRRRVLGARGSEDEDRNGLIPRSEEPAPIGPPPKRGEALDRRSR
ncbi:MAG TPA: DUF3618 domain-containing protein [Sphingomicrobium sp.]|jgi:hypothetical protein|nr:DUF3618 domain-containing protein [Sphingomicrobium sp.]